MISGDDAMWKEGYLSEPCTFILIHKRNNLRSMDSFFFICVLHAWCHLKFQKQESTGRMNKVGTWILREGSSLILAMKTQTCLTQPKWPTLCNFNPAFPTHLDHSTWVTYIFIMCLFSWISGGCMQCWLTIWKGLCGKKPYKVTFDLQSNSPFVAVVHEPRFQKLIFTAPPVIPSEIGIKLKLKV